MCLCSRSRSGDELRLRFRFGRSRSSSEALSLEEGIPIATRVDGPRKFERIPCFKFKPVILVLGCHANTRHNMKM